MQQNPLTIGANATVLQAARRVAKHDSSYACEVGKGDNRYSHGEGRCRMGRGEGVNHTPEIRA